MADLTEEKYRSLKRDVEEAKSAADKAQGALDQQMKRLKEEFECGTLKEAKAKLAELESKRDKAKREFDKLAEDYEEKWKQA